MAEAWEPFFPYHVEHIVARQHGGADNLENLAFACHHYNAFKGPNLASLDPDSGQLTRLFHPRQQLWMDHFRWDGHTLLGITDTGRTTVFLLQMNSPDRIELRQANSDLYLAS